jgi:hypothetical protein
LPTKNKKASANAEAFFIAIFYVYLATIIFLLTRFPFTISE